VVISTRFSVVFVGFSLLALLVMNFDRYLATYYPIFHRTSVTKGRLLTLLAILITVEVTLMLISYNDFVITYQVGLLIFFIIIFLPMLFINYKLFAVARKSRRNKRISPEMKKTFSLKNISSCLLAVACFVVLNIPVFVYIGLNITLTAKEWTLDNALLAALWASTTTSMNSTFNCSIFYWKNKILRTEGMKVIKSMKICRRVQT
jgi:small-conductance mechanosensitive channel